MAEFMLDFFGSFFRAPSAWGIGLALAFGVVWLATFAPWCMKTGLRATTMVAVPLAVFLSSAILALAAIAFVQIPLQMWTGQALAHFWSQETLARWILLAGIPQVLLSGLVQEAAKLVPPLIYMKWRRPREVRTAVIMGAIAGAGFGVFEAQWVLNTIFAGGWTWDWVQAFGFDAIIGFWERFFAIALHVGATAIAAYGLFKGKGWQFYLLAALLHSLTNYGVVLLQGAYLSVFQVEIYIGAIALLTVAIALWLRWRPQREERELALSGVGGADAGESRL